MNGKTLTPLERELVEVLMDVVNQACYRNNGTVCHDFISGYEQALGLLERLGFAFTKDDVYYTLKWPGEE